MQFINAYEELEIVKPGDWEETFIKTTEKASGAGGWRKVDLSSIEFFLFFVGGGGGMKTAISQQV